jgi:hypothetical protein
MRTDVWCSPRSVPASQSTARAPQPTVACMTHRCHPPRIPLPTCASVSSRQRGTGLHSAVCQLKPQHQSLRGEASRAKHQQNSATNASLSLEQPSVNDFLFLQSYFPDVEGLLALASGRSDSGADTYSNSTPSFGLTNFGEPAGIFRITTPLLPSVFNLPFATRRAFLLIQTCPFCATNCHVRVEPCVTAPRF